MPVFTNILSCLKPIIFYTPQMHTWYEHLILFYRVGNKNLNVNTKLLLGVGA